MLLRTLSHTSRMELLEDSLSIALQSMDGAVNFVSTLQPHNLRDYSQSSADNVFNTSMPSITPSELKKAKFTKCETSLRAESRRQITVFGSMTSLAQLGMAAMGHYAVLRTNRNVLHFLLS